MTADRVDEVKIQLDCLSSTDIRVVDKIFKEKGPVSNYKELLSLFTEASNRYYEILNIKKGKSDKMTFNDMVKKQRNINKGIIESTLSPYELVRIQDDRITEESELSSLINMSDRYHIVDYNGNTLATAKTLEDCIPQINKVSGWGANAVIDQKDLVAYDIKYSVWGAGHSYASHLVPRY